VPTNSVSISKVLSMSAASALLQIQPLHFSHAVLLTGERGFGIVSSTFTTGSLTIVIVIRARRVRAFL
jgi:hypothetical protein